MGCLKLVKEQTYTGLRVVYGVAVNVRRRSEKNEVETTIIPLD